MFHCRRCGCTVNWDDWRSELKPEDRLNWSGFPWGQELDWMLSLISDIEVKKMIELLKAMQSVEDYELFSGGHINFLLEEFEKELMCRREGLDRLKMEKEEYDKRVAEMLKGEETSAPEDEGLDTANKNGDVKADQAPFSSPSTAKKEEESAEWV